MKIKQISAEEFTGGPHLFQSRYWALVKTQNGWKPYYFSYGDRQFLVLLRSFLRGLFSLAYIPMGLSSDIGAAELCTIAEEVRSFLPKSTIALTFDFPYSDNRCIPGTLRPSFYTVQPQGTVINKLGSAAEYRNRAVRSLKKNRDIVSMRVWDGNEDEFSLWYGIYRQTAKRDGFTARGSAYIKNVLLLGRDENSDVKAELLLAEVGGKIEGGIVILRNCHMQLYLYGAANRSESFNVSYVLQDCSLNRAADYGCLLYDFYGAEGENGIDAHLKSLTRFKLAFGGTQVFKAPACDYPYRRFFYGIYTVTQRLRMRLARQR